MSTHSAELIVEAVLAAFVSGAEEDERGERANVVDGLFAIARSLHEVASCISMVGRVLEDREA